MNCAAGAIYADFWVDQRSYSPTKLYTKKTIPTRQGIGNTHLMLQDCSRYPDPARKLTSLLEIIQASH